MFARYTMVSLTRVILLIDAFVDALDLAEMSFEGVEPAAWHPSMR
jgi:hypothetical protein